MRAVGARCGVMRILMRKFPATGFLLRSFQAHMERSPGQSDADERSQSRLLAYYMDDCWEPEEAVAILRENAAVAAREGSPLCFRVVENDLDHARLVSVDFGRDRAHQSNRNIGRVGHRLRACRHFLPATPLRLTRSNASGQPPRNDGKPSAETLGSDRRMLDRTQPRFLYNVLRVMFGQQTGDPLYVGRCVDNDRLSTLLRCDHPRVGLGRPQRDSGDEHRRSVIATGERLAIGDRQETIHGLD